MARRTAARTIEPPEPVALPTAEPPTVVDEIDALTSYESAVVRSWRSRSERTSPAAPLPLTIAGARLLSAILALLTAIIAVSLYPIVTPNGCIVALLSTVLIGYLLWFRIAVAPGYRAAIITLASLLLIVAHSPWAGLLGVGLLFAAAAEFGDPGTQRLCRGLLLSTILMAAVLLMDGSGLLWEESSRAFWGVTGSLTRISGLVRRLGIVQAGGIWLLFAACLWLSQGILGRRRSVIFQIRMMLFLFLSGTVFLSTNYMPIAWAIVALLAAASDWNVPDEDREHAPRTDIASRQRNGRRPYLLAAGTLLLLAAPLCLAMFCCGESTNSPVPLSIGIVEGGLKSLILPNETNLRNREEADFGALQKLFPLFGWDVQTIPETFSSRDLSGRKVLLVINPTKAPTKEQQVALESYVRDGGRLMVLGDHTNIGGIMQPLNQTLSFTSIRFRFDSAIPLDKGWKWQHCLRAAGVPAFWQQQNDKFGISVGASLETGSSARALVVGDGGFSDVGNPDYGASRLGNMTYDPGERLGGLVLAAEERVGKGVVQVWGDTSGFQNGSLTHTYSFLTSSLITMTTTRPYAISRQLVVGFTIVLGLVGLFFVRSSPALLLASLIGFSAIPGLVLSFHRVEAPRPHEKSTYALLDNSHRPAYPQPGTEMSMTRLSETFLRRGRLLLAADNASSLSEESAETRVIIAPTQTYSAVEADSIARYIHKGGKLLIIAGYPSRDSLRPLLTQFGMDIAPEPYGAAHNSRLVYSAWRPTVLHTTKPPLQADQGASNRDAAYDAEIPFQEAYPIIANDATPLVTCWARPLAVMKRYGAGNIVLIADSRFCTDKNLAPNRKIHETNIRFLLQCIQ